MRKVVVFVLLCLPIFAPAQVQESEAIHAKKTILIVPFNRFEFHTEYPLHEIADANEVGKYEVFDLYRNNFLNTIATHECTAFRFKVINAVNLSFLTYRVSYEDDKKYGYYASNLSRLTVADLQRIMHTYNADYILFVNLYQVKKEIFFGMGKASLGAPFSSHFIDFDIYNAQKERLGWQQRYEIENLLTTESLARKGLHSSDLKKGIIGFAEFCCTLLNTNQGETSD